MNRRSRQSSDLSGGADTKSLPRMTQPAVMKSERYVYGVEPVNGNDAWALFVASAIGDIDAVEALIKRDSRLVNAQYWYQFPIHLAVYAGQTKVVALLLSRGADPGQSRFTYNSWDKLLLAARERGFHQIESLLQRAMKKRFGYEPDFELLKNAIIARDSRRIGSVLRHRPELAAASDALGNNALHWSVITRQLPLITRFIQSGSPIDAKRADGQTPVLLAANGAYDYWYRETRGRSHPSLRNTSVLVGSLLALGAEYTISVAAAVGDQERVEQLCKKDPHLARRRDSARVTPLSYAASAGHLHIVRFLLEQGADPNTPEDCATDGFALFEACRGNHFLVAQLLLEHGANPNAGVDSSGCCLTIAETFHGEQAKPLQKLLREHGAVTPSYAITSREMKQAILHRTDALNDGEFFEQLLQKRDRRLLGVYLTADPTMPARIDSGLDISGLNSPSLVRRLLEAGMDPNGPDWLGRTFLHVCAERGDAKTAATLLAAGADINSRDIEYQGTPLAAAVRVETFRNDLTESQNEERRRHIVQFLLDRGAATNLPDDKPWATPLAWARKRGMKEIEQMLLSHEAT